MNISMRLYNSATRTITPLELKTPGHVSMYVCGPTVYDLPHLGHGRSMVTYDVLRRYLEATGLNVNLVSNITDVDDKILNRAAETGEDYLQLARRYETAWNDALDSLGVLRPDHAPRATEYVTSMVSIIQKMVETGHAYDTPRGVFFDTSRVDDYGLLAHQDMDALQEGARVNVEDIKKNAGDFVLWKPAQEGETSWPSPWGNGRPGWHTECVAMSTDLLGEHFDLHAGGMDLSFPHHENERAQATALGSTFAGHWVHHAFVEVNGKKMGKSLGNFRNLTELLETTDPRAYRLLLLQSHYRSPVEVNRDTISNAERALARLDNTTRRISENVAPDPVTLAEFHQQMDDDLNTPQALVVLFDAIRTANALRDMDPERSASLVAAVRQAAAILGLDLAAPATGPDEEAQALAQERDKARSEKNWALSDQLRTQLEELGYTVQDTSSGTNIFRS